MRSLISVVKMVKSRCIMSKRSSVSLWACSSFALKTYHVHALKMWCFFTCCTDTHREKYRVQYIFAEIYFFSMDFSQTSSIIARRSDVIILPFDVCCINFVVTAECDKHSWSRKKTDDAYAALTTGAKRVLQNSNLWQKSDIDDIMPFGDTTQNKYLVSLFLWI